MIFCWIVTIFGTSIGALVLVVGLASSKGAPQEAAAAAIAVAIAVIPYCFTRAIEGIRNTGRDTGRDAEAHLRAGPPAPVQMAADAPQSAHVN